MVELGYALSSEEHAPNDLVRYARRAEEVGFEFALISDHYHPWTDQQGHAPFIWSVLGGIAQVTQRILVGTGVTCPTMRYHPALVAQMAGTAAAMMPGRFFLGLGSGEALNEHIYGQHWPPADVRLEMLEEAVRIIRLLWNGEESSYWGEYFSVENACIHTLPENAIPIYIAASGLNAAELVGEIGDGLISTKADAEVVRRFEESGGSGKPRIGQIKVCWAEDEAEAMDTAFMYWPIALIPGSLHADLPTPAHFEETVSLMRKEDIASQIVLGNTVERYLEKIQQMEEAGFDHIYLHQIGPDQEGFFRFAQKEILPRFSDG
jgi:G6PDH family F420-dependent oxidoreductase